MVEGKLTVVVVVTLFTITILCVESNVTGFVVKKVSFWKIHLKKTSALGIKWLIRY